MLECVGEALGEHSFLVKCDCGSHIIEVIYYQNSDGSVDGGIEFFGTLFQDYRFPYVQLDTQQEFTRFLESIVHLVQCKKQECFTFYSYGNIKNERKILGRLEVSYDDMDYLNLAFYKREVPLKNRNKEKVVWDICLRITTQDEFSKQCKKMLRLINDSNREEY